MYADRTVVLIGAADSGATTPPIVLAVTKLPFAAAGAAVAAAMAAAEAAAAAGDEEAAAEAGAAAGAAGHSAILLDGRSLAPLCAEFQFRPSMWVLPIERIDPSAKVFGTQCFWDTSLAQRAFEQPLKDVGGKRVQSMAMSHDGRTFAAGGNFVLALFDTVFRA
ncbi:hypothetical protein T492DRAFT_840026 [Pavlovales sp. CCMP2436]|nr:hypothetical protein T492DRAFT_840026 [Pavlovales sp. CCMP2436]